MDLYLSFLLILNGLTGIHSITTVSKVSVKARDSISIPCLYDSQYRDHVKYLCNGNSWPLCSYAVKTNQPSSGKFSISDDKDQRIFTVTIEDLTNQDRDYWCAVEIDGGADVRAYFEMSVTKDTPSLYVDHQQISAFKGDDLTINCYHRISGETKWCRLGSSCVTESPGFIDETEVTINENLSVFTVTMSGLKIESSGWYWCVKGGLQMPVHVTVLEQPTTTTSHVTNCFADRAPTTVEEDQDSVPVGLMNFIIPLSLLICAVIVALFIWFISKRNNQTKVEPSATTMVEEAVTYSTVNKKRKTSAKLLHQAEEEATYSNVKLVRKTSGKRSDADMKSDKDVTYSSVVTVKPQAMQRVEPKAEDVTYSTLAQHQQNP